MMLGFLVLAVVGQAEGWNMPKRCASVATMKVVLAAHQELTPSGSKLTALLTSADDRWSVLFLAKHIDSLTPALAHVFDLALLATSGAQANEPVVAARARELLRNALFLMSTTIQNSIKALRRALQVVKSPDVEVEYRTVLRVTVGLGDQLLDCLPADDPGPAR